MAGPHEGDPQSHIAGNERTPAQREHARALQQYLATGKQEFLDACLAHAAAGERAVYTYLTTGAALQLLGATWHFRSVPQVALGNLLRTYIDLGEIRVDERMAIAAIEPPYGKFRGMWPLEVAVRTLNAEAACILIECGALESTDFTRISKEDGHLWAPDPKVGATNLNAFETFCNGHWTFGGSDLARISEAIMTRRIALGPAPTLSTDFPSLVTSRRSRAV